jgi:hypothetical protein
VSRRIRIGKHDITEHVAAMYDAIIQSGEWGSEFLDTEQVASILVVGKLAGWGLATYRGDPVPDPGDPPVGLGRYPYDAERVAQRNAWLERRRLRWQAQIDAMVAAKIAEAEVEP